MGDILRRLWRFLKSLPYFFILLLKSVYILFLLAKFFISLRIKWWISLYRVKRHMHRQGVKTVDMDEVAKKIVGKYPSIKRIYKSLRESMEYE